MAKSVRTGAGWVGVILVTGFAFGLPFIHSTAFAQDVEPRGADPVNQVVFLYESGRLDEAEHLALKTLDSPGLLSRSAQSELYLVLAFCSIANDDEENGLRHFVSAIKFNPNLKPDPIGWSPKVRRVFDRAKEERVRIAELEAQRELSMEAEICRRAAFNSMILPGSGQVDKGHARSGLTQGILFWGGLATTIYAQSKLAGLRKDYRDAIKVDEIEKAYDDYRFMSRLAVVSGSVTVTIYSFSVIDALHRKPAAAIIDEKR